MIQLRPLLQGDPACDYIYTLYYSAFPPDERRPWDNLMSLCYDGSAFSLLLVTDDDAPVGFITVWTWSEWRYAEHFAIDPACRGGGIGARVMQAVLQSDARPMVLEVELPADDLSRRRIGFYSRLGFTLRSDFHYVQPAYSPQSQPLPLHLMTWGAPAHEPLAPVAAMLHREVYGVK